MLAISMTCLLLGAALGQRFTVRVLVPTMAIVMALSVGAGWSHPHAAWWIVKIAGVAAICLQCGYFAGIISRHFLTAMRSQRSSRLAGAETQRHHPAAR
jgi:Na+-translocating ferredoxin:NAD+ oxidoreductase RnfD subunit